MLHLCGFLTRAANKNNSPKNPVFGQKSLDIFWQKIPFIFPKDHLKKDGWLSLCKISKSSMNHKHNNVYL
jgi:hypothetical protein